MRRQQPGRPSRPDDHDGVGMVVIPVTDAASPVLGILGYPASRTHGVRLSSEDDRRGGANVCLRIRPPRPTRVAGGAVVRM